MLRYLHTTGIYIIDPTQIEPSRCIPYVLGKCVILKISRSLSSEPILRKSEAVLEHTAANSANLLGFCISRPYHLSTLNYKPYYNLFIYLFL